MRVLVVAAPLLGHLFPLVPLARALWEAGHRVTLAAGGATGVAGMPVRDIAPGFSLGRIAAPLMLRHPVLARREIAGRAGTAVVGRLFGAANAGFLTALREVAREVRPDVVIHEPLAPAGAIVAAELGVPAVLQENNLFPARELRDVVLAAAPLRDHQPPEPALTLTTTPASLGGARAGHPLRPVPYGGEGDVPEWLLERPRVVVSRSTVPGPGADPTGIVAAAASGVDAEFVLVRPAERVTRAGLPGNVRVVGRVPLDRVLPHAAAFVHHGGAGSVLGALAAGCPQLVLPGPGDRRHNAEVVARRGAGLAVEAKALSAAELTRLVTDPRLRAAARQVRDEIAAMPPPEEVVPAIAALG